MGKILALGNDAVAMGAIDAGISGVYAYPGTPSTEITEFIQKSAAAHEGKIKDSWSVNEKTAYEAALGMSYAGKRCLVCMKHVGLNVAADGFMNSAITGVNGGLVLAVADDPSMHSSQNEQDSRVYAKFAMIPVLEPSDQQEAYDMTRQAFELSEELQLPVMLRLTTRISHTRSGIERKTPKNQNNLDPVSGTKRFILLPANARKQYQSLLDKQPSLELMSSESSFNRVIPGSNKSLGVVTFGIAFTYIMEIRSRYGLDFPVLKIGQYPLNRTEVTRFFNLCEKVLVVEEGYPVYEELFRGFFNENRSIHGKLDGFIPRSGELKPEYISKALKANLQDKHTKVPEALPKRPPMLCHGCSHRDVYDALTAVIGENNNSVFSDIGCYTLGALPPFNAISTCVDMGASITMAKGAADAGMHPVIAVIGDSTFTHSGITGLLDAVHDKSPMTVIISDNSTTAMTGGQKSSGEGKYVSICEGIGVEKAHIRTLSPIKKYRDNNISILEEEINYKGVSVILAERECIQTLGKRKKAETDNRPTN